ncbi:DUF3579 domain-containing protein [Yanghanlia caeni]|uniref:DUF3579 domain-containing protein n=1 Tax=Yanghanlia caeni TaxID=3064283 RepID=A0ABU1D6V1_9BURK|nr:DUF3579 domain-containing protein [Alcaligenaceae bacterium LG-2]NGR08858.1 DUF3579 domain-containing protein [bacterium SGD-2]HZH56744.1 DUF3579 domain-containing protein [Burkholderiaceae bacterium]
MTQQVEQFIIHGLTKTGQRFRPSDWAERLAGVMAQFRPAGSSGGHLSYSPYVVPVNVDGVRCVVVDKRLRDLEPLAWKFVCGFAADNNLQTSERVVSPAQQSEILA